MSKWKYLLNIRVAFIVITHWYIMWDHSATGFGKEWTSKMKCDLFVGYA
jgi:hypothetical protein